MTVCINEKGGIRLYEVLGDATPAILDNTKTEERGKGSRRVDQARRNGHQEKFNLAGWPPQAKGE